jgi:two-component system chemotaxis sensor kinase CheA
MDPMSEIRDSFFLECEELLEALHDALGSMSAGDGDPEVINVAFRAVHSIKGGAGAFGLSDLVGYAHRFETVMDAVRAGRLAPVGDVLRRFYDAADGLADFVRAARSGAGAPPVPPALALLEAALGPVQVHPEEAVDFQPLALALDVAGAADVLPGGDPEGDCWTVTFAPSAELYSSGNEPLLLLRALAALGSASVRCDLRQVPQLSALNPEDACLSWTISVRGPTDPDRLREVFEFVEDVATIEVRPNGTAPERDSHPLPPCTQGSSAALGPVDGAALPDAGYEPGPSVPPRQAMAKPPSSAGAETTASQEVPSSAMSSTVRVDVARIDRLVNLVGELVINQAMLAQSVAEAGLPPNSPVMNGLEGFMMLTRDIQDSVMMIRAQPVKPLFQRMARIVREASQTIGKEVRLVTEGEATEVDKTVIERLAEPLTHMIRNAVDHGVEHPDARAAAGKTPEGVITLSASHRSGRIVIEMSDDGAGIDRRRVLEMAVRKGLVAPDAAMTDADIDNIIFLPGFSTAPAVSSLSGRGVGMDVVKRSIQALGGRIAIASVPGAGTRIAISLPLTLAVLDGMVVRVADETLVLPLSAIVETAALTPSDIRALGSRGCVIHNRGRFVPLYDLGVEFGFREPLADYAGGIVLLTTSDDGGRSALVVDAILEQRQVVIKGLGEGFAAIPGVAAATILGDGRIALIVDPSDLVRAASGRTRPLALEVAG